MANPQINELIDYIKKAKLAGQTDEQTRQILLKNGWSFVEADEAFVAIAAADKPQPVESPAVQPGGQTQVQQVQSQPQPQIQTQLKPQPQTQTQLQPQQVQPQAQPQNKPVETQKTGRIVGGRFVTDIVIALIVLAVLGGGGYFAIKQTSAIQNLLEKFLPYKANPPANLAVENQTAETQQPAQLNLVTVKMATVLQNYDITKITIASVFSESSGKVAYCAPQKIGGKIDCFLNDEKLSNSYNYKPYWIGISPNGKRVLFLYLDSVKKQSFIFENDVEGARYDGTIISPRFSDDSLGFMYTVAGNNNKSYPVYNGKPGTVHDKIFGIPKLSSDGKYLLYGARDGQDIFWVADAIK